MRQSVLAFAVIVFATNGSHALADVKNPTFVDDVLPVFKQHCNNCHGNDQQKGDLNLASYAALQQGGSSGAVVTPGNPDKSRLFLLTNRTAEPKMPPKSVKIPDAQIALLKLWIEQGAKENAGSKVSFPATPKTDIGLKSVVKGRPKGPPPMPAMGKLKLDPVYVARRPGAVLALATSPWAPLAAIGGQKQVVLYNTDTGDLLGVIPFDHGQINSIKFSRNAKFVLVAGGKGGASGKAVLFKVENGEKVIEVGGSETDAILAADISADQTQTAVGGPSKIVRVYSTTDGSVLREVKKHTDWVTAVEYSSDGVLLATGDRNGGLFAWEAFTGREYFALRGHTALDAAKTELDKATPIATAAANKVVALEVVVNAESAAAKTIADAAAKVPSNVELATASKKATDALAVLSNELASAKKSMIDTAATFKTATDKHVAAAKAHSDAMTQVAENQKKAVAIQPMVKPATDAVVSAKASLDAANAAVVAAKASFDRANADAIPAKAIVERLKTVAVGTK